MLKKVRSGKIIIITYILFLNSIQAQEECIDIKLKVKPYKEGHTHCIITVINKCKDSLLVSNLGDYLLLIEPYEYQVRKFNDALTDYPLWYKKRKITKDSLKLIGKVLVEGAHSSEPELPFVVLGKKGKERGSIIYATTEQSKLVIRAFNKKTNKGLKYIYVFIPTRGVKYSKKIKYYYLARTEIIYNEYE